MTPFQRNSWKFWFNNTFQLGINKNNFHLKYDPKIFLFSNQYALVQYGIGEENYIT